MGILTSRTPTVKTASDRHNASVRLRPGQSAVALGVNSKMAKAQASKAKAKRPKAEAPTDHPDIKRSTPAELLGRDPIQLLREQNSYLRKRVEQLQKIANQAKQKLEAAQGEKRQGLKDACTVAAGLRREVQGLQREKKELEMKVSRLTRDLNARRDECTALTNEVERLRAVALGAATESP